MFKCTRCQMAYTENFHELCGTCQEEVWNDFYEYVSGYSQLELDIIDNKLDGYYLKEVIEIESNKRELFQS